MINGGQVNRWMNSFLQSWWAESLPYARQLPAWHTVGTPAVVGWPSPDDGSSQLLPHWTTSMKAEGAGRSSRVAQTNCCQAQEAGFAEASLPPPLAGDSLAAKFLKKKKETN